MDCTRLLRVLRFYGLLLTAFVAAKVAFMLLLHGEELLSVTDVLQVLWHGLSQDLSTASYLLVIPWLCLFITVWTEGKWGRPVMKTYALLCTTALSVILVSDIVVYHFWQTKLDATVFNYIDDPKGMTASVSGWFLLLCIVTILCLAAVMIWAFWRIGRKGLKPCRHRVTTSVAFVLLGGVMFLMIRGGVGRSTMNIAHVYFSDRQFLNHSAVNPAFSLFYSALKAKNYDKLYRYFDDEELDGNFRDLAISQESLLADTLLNNSRPNIVIVLMEGLGAQFVEPLGGKKNVTPALNKLSEEGVLFTRCYANSFRTDRGTVSLLSGYPAFPTLSVMKLTNKYPSLPSIARSLRLNGYKTSFLYGGDKNFTNANGYLLATGFEAVRGDESFPLSVRTTHAWGVTDHIVLDTLYREIVRHESPSPFFITCQTLASHEDWKVPYNRIPNDEKANSMAYLDDCIGHLVEQLKKSPAWENLLVIFIPDHGIAYPEKLGEDNPKRYHIPMLWTGGAVKRAKKIDLICNQSDLAATLLGQLSIDHSDFVFSRDVTSRSYTYPWAIHTFSNGVAFIDSTGYTVEDLNSQRVLADSPSPSTMRLKNAHTLLQKTINDFSLGH